jgi:hypothetical protein
MRDRPTSTKCACAPGCAGALSATQDFMMFWCPIRYLNVIKSVRLRVDALVFKGSFAAFELF